MSKIELCNRWNALSVNEQEEMIHTLIHDIRYRLDREELNAALYDITGLTYYRPKATPVTKSALRTSPVTKTNPAMPQQSNKALDAFVTVCAVAIVGFLFLRS